MGDRSRPWLYERGTELYNQEEEGESYIIMQAMMAVRSAVVQMIGLS
jgi:hypothetical protein